MTLDDIKELSKLNFTGRESYIQWRSSWRSLYKELSKRISSAKRSRKVFANIPNPAYTGNTTKRWVRIPNTYRYEYPLIAATSIESELYFLRIAAKNMMEIRLESKVKAKGFRDTEKLAKAA